MVQELWRLLAVIVSFNLNLGSEQLISDLKY